MAKIGTRTAIIIGSVILTLGVIGGATSKPHTCQAGVRKALQLITSASAPGVPSGVCVMMLAQLDD